MQLDGGFSQAKLPGDFLFGVPSAQAGQHFAFPWGKAGLAHSGLCRRAGQCQRNIDFAGGHEADGVDDRACWQRFGQIAGGAAGQHLVGHTGWRQPRHQGDRFAAVGGDCLSGGLAWNQRLGAFGLSAGLSRAADGWRLGLGLVVGLWHAAGRWHAATAGLTRSGAVLTNLFIDDDGDNQRDAGEAAVPNGRFIVGNSLRSETTGGDGHVLLRGLPTGLPVDVETQLASLPDFSLRPARPGDRLRLRPGEVRTLAIPLQPTGSVEAQILLVTGTARTPRSGVPVTLHDARGNPVARGVTDFEGYVLFEGLPFGHYSVEAAGQSSADIALPRGEPNRQISVLVPPLTT